MSTSPKPVERLTPADGEQYYISALEWIRFTASMHYIGDAFDPVHMRELANFAIAALRGEPITDYDQATARAKEKAAEMMAWFDSMDEERTGAEQS
jgi:hypothetical protein